MATAPVTRKGGNVREHALLELATRQHGLVERSQVLGLGLSEPALRHRVATGRLVRVHPGVYRVAGHVATRPQRLLAACLAAGEGSAVSHRAAAEEWSLADGFHDIVEIVTPRARWPRLRHVAVHRSTDLRPDHVTVRHGVPVTKPVRTLVDLGAVAPWTVPDALERGLTAKLFGLAAADAVLDDLGSKGRTGVGVFRRALDDRALGRDVPESILEVRMARLIRRRGIPMPAYQHWVTPDVRVDFAYPALMIAIEVDGFGVHGTPEATSADFVRQNRLVGLGWTVLRFTWRQVVKQPDQVARDVLVTYTAAMARKA
jgi:very-short-patch-repair endonuclease